MFRNFIKITFRNMMKHKTYVFINVVGLGIALACCIVAYLNWEFNTKFDTYHTNTEDVYKINFVRITNGRPIKNGSCPIPLGDQIETSIPEVAEVIRYYPLGGNFKVDNQVFNVDLAAVDPGFLETFRFPVVTGTLDITDKRSIVISDELKNKYFRDIDNPVGQTLTYINDELRIDFRVGGVFQKPPKNNSFGSEAFVLYDNLWDVTTLKPDNWAFFNSTFVRISERSQLTTITDKLDNYIAIQNEQKPDYKVDEFYLEPFQGMAVRAEREDVWNHWFNRSLPSAAASSPGIMAFLILLIACFNFTNTSIATANRRIKEIGIRKVLGSGRKQLILQFMGENIVMVILSLFAGLVFSAFLVPAYSAMWPFLEIKLDLLANLDLLGFLVLLLLGTAVLAGMYPALFISSFQPNTILRGTVKFSGTNTFTRILLTLQYAISLMAIIAGFVFSQNATYQEEYDMGFDMESVVFAFVHDEQGYNKMRNELAGYAEINELAGSTHSISRSWYTDPINHEGSELDVSIFDIGAGYISTVGAELLKGRDFTENSASDAKNSVIINEELARTMGWNDPLGQRIVLKDSFALNVIGVVKDIYFEGGLWDPLSPMLLRYALPTEFRYITASVAPENLLAVKQIMDEKWSQIFPDELSTVSFMDEEMAGSLLVNRNIKSLFIFLGIVAALLSVIGLFSMVSLNLVKRMKEIAVRKVFGASIWDIALKISKEFIILLLISSLLGAAGGYFLSDMLMASIWAYHIPQQVITLVMAILLLLLVSALTIGGKVYRAASKNPALVLGDQ